MFVKLSDGETVNAFHVVSIAYGRLPEVPSVKMTEVTLDTGRCIHCEYDSHDAIIAALQKAVDDYRDIRQKALG
jgi:hypothetical protein